MRSVLRVSLPAATGHVNQGLEALVVCPRENAMALGAALLPARLSWVLSAGLVALCLVWRALVYSVEPRIEQ